MTTGGSRLKVRQQNNITWWSSLTANILDEARSSKPSGRRINSIIEGAGARLMISFANVDHPSSAARGR